MVCDETPSCGGVFYWLDETGGPGRSGNKPAAAIGILFKKVGQLSYHGAAKLFDIGDGHCPTVITGDIMANTDGQQLDG